MQAVSANPARREGHLQARAETSPILIVPYVWIGDFVRGHSVVQVLHQRWPERPVDLLTTSLCAPLVDYMPGVRRGIVADLPRSRVALRQQHALAKTLRSERYGAALIMPRTWKSALAPFLAGIPVRTGFAGEMRFGLLNDLRWGERALPRMVDRCAALALPPGTSLPTEWPRPQLVVTAAEIGAWKQRLGLAQEGSAIALCPGAVGPAKRWPAGAYAALAAQLTARGHEIWVLGGSAETAIAGQVVAGLGPRARDLTGNDLRNAILALAAARAAISNDSGLLHVAAALGTPTLGIFGPTSPWHWAPLNPLAGVLQRPKQLPCQPCHKPVCWMGHHLCMRDISVEQVLAATDKALAQSGPSPLA